MRRYLFFVIMAICCSLTNGTLAQTVRNVRSIDGMTGENVNRIFKDSRGLMWMATDAGLAYYNGRTVSNFKMGEEDARVEVTDAAELSDGRVIAATTKGLMVTDFASQTCIPFAEEITNATTVLRLKQRLFVGGKAGIYECNEEGKVINHTTLENNVISLGNAVHDLCTADKTHLWVCGNQKVLRYDINTRKLQSVALDTLISSGNATCVAQMGNLIYIGTSNNGLLCYDPATNKAENCRWVPVLYVNDLTVFPKENHLVICGNKTLELDIRQKQIVAIYGKDERAGNDMVLPSDGSYTFLRDETLGVDWFGFFLEGFAYNYHKRPMVHIYRFGDFDTAQLQVRSFCVHGKDIIIGTRKGLYHVDEAAGEVHDVAPDVLRECVVTSVRWFAGRFIVTTYGHGLYTYDPRTQQFSIPEGDKDLKNGNFSQAVVSPDSTQVFVGGNLGLFVFDRNIKQVKRFTSHNSELPDTYIPNVFFDRQGKAWISTMENLCIYDPKTDKLMARGFPKDFFNTVPMLSFNQDDDGDVLAMVPNRVFKSKTDMSSYQEFDLSKTVNVGAVNFLYPIKGRYLMGTSTGLFLFEPNFRDYMQFSEADNLPSLNFNKQEIQLTEDGRLWMANCKGLIYIEPGEINHMKDSVAGHIVLDRLLIDDRNCGVGTLFNLMNKPEIHLSWNFFSERLTFVPLLLNYAERAGRFYEYRLNGDEWITTREGEEANIESLSWGTHQLDIRLAGHPETTSTYTVQVLPSLLFYFEVLFFVTLVIAIWALLRLRQRSRIHRQKLRMKHQLDREIAAQSAVRQVLQQQQQEREAYELEQEKLRQQRTSGKEYRELQRRVKEYMELERPWRSVNFRLSDLAKAVDSSPTMISLMLNQNLNTNFYDFVNRYRLDEFKRRCRDDKFKHLSMMTLAEQCGFKKTTFFAVFKKFEGCTPSEWMKNN